MLVADLIDLLREMPPTASVYIEMRTPPLVPGSGESPGDIRGVTYDQGNVEITIGMYPELVED